MYAAEDGKTKFGFRFVNTFGMNYLNIQYRAAISIIIATNIYNRMAWFLRCQNFNYRNIKII